MESAMQNQRFPMSQKCTLELEKAVIQEELANSPLKLTSAIVPAFSVENEFIFEDESGTVYRFSDDRTQIGDTSSFRALVRIVCAATQN
jgi:hypothetical protein